MISSEDMFTDIANLKLRHVHDHKVVSWLTRLDLGLEEVSSMTVVEIRHSKIARLLYCLPRFPHSACIDCGNLAATGRFWSGFWNFNGSKWKPCWWRLPLCYASFHLHFIFVCWFSAPHHFRFQQTIRFKKHRANKFTRSHARIGTTESDWVVIHTVQGFLMLHCLNTLISFRMNYICNVPVNDDKHAGLAFKCSDLDASEQFISSVLAAHVRTMLVSSVSMTPPPVEQYCRNWWILTMHI